MEEHFFFLLFFYLLNALLPNNKPLHTFDITCFLITTRNHNKREIETHITRMTLPFFHKGGVKKKRESPTLSSLIQKSSIDEVQQKTTTPDLLDEEDIDENFFYKHITTHFHSLFCESPIICIPHSRSIEGLVLTKDIIGKKKQDYAESN